MIRQTRWRVLLLFCVVSLTWGCATTPPVSSTEMPVLIDPRYGFEGDSPKSAERKLSSAWQKLRLGQFDAAEKVLISIETRTPRYAPATVGRAIVALSRGQLDLAQRFIEKAADPGSPYFAAEAYRAEIALGRGLTEDAYRIYDRISELPGVPNVVVSRYEVVSDEWFEELIARIAVATDRVLAIELLEEAVAVRPRSDSTRIALARNLIAEARLDDATIQVEALLDRGLVESPDVQRIVADIEAARGEYQNAIVRLEKLVQRYPDLGFEARLAEVKLDYMRANLPPRYHTAVRSSAINREDLAVLAYWHVSAVRFARVSAPPIAVDIAGIPGRDEIVRALGLGILSVDRARRSVDPGRTVSGGAFLNTAGRLLRLGATPECAAGFGGSEALVRCGVPVARMVAAPPDPVSGVAAIAAFDAIDDLIELTK